MMFFRKVKDGVFFKRSRWIYETIIGYRVHARTLINNMWITANCVQASAEFALMFDFYYGLDVGAIKVIQENDHSWNSQFFLFCLLRREGMIDFGSLLKRSVASRRLLPSTRNET